MWDARAAAPPAAAARSRVSSRRTDFHAHGHLLIRSVSQIRQSRNTPRAACYPGALPDRSSAASKPRSPSPTETPRSASMSSPQPRRPPLARAIGALSPDVAVAAPGRTARGRCRRGGAGLARAGTLLRAADRLPGPGHRTAIRPAGLLPRRGARSAAWRCSRSWTPENEGELWRKLLASTVSESLMVAASRQYVKGADTETWPPCSTSLPGAPAACCGDTSTALRPDMDPAARRALVDAPLAAARDGGHDAAAGPGGRAGETAAEPAVGGAGDGGRRGARG